MIDQDRVTDWRKAHRQPGLTELAVCQRLRQLAAEVPADRAIVELGAYCGRATGWLLLGAQDGHGAHVTSVDPWGMRADGYDAHSGAYVKAEQRWRDHMTAIGATDAEVTAAAGFAVEVGCGWGGSPVGLLWHDAEHSADAVAADLAAWLPHMAERSVIVLHDVALPRLGVVAGARRVLDPEQWDWAGAQTLLWRKRPGLRGAMVIRRARA